MGIPTLKNFFESKNLPNNYFASTNFLRTWTNLFLGDVEAVREKKGDDARIASDICCVRRKKRMSMRAGVQEKTRGRRRKLLSIHRTAVSPASQLSLPPSFLVRFFSFSLACRSTSLSLQHSSIVKVSGLVRFPVAFRLRFRRQQVSRF